MEGKNSPINFSVVEPGKVYRSGFPEAVHQSFLESLTLQSVIYLCPQPYNNSILEFLRWKNIDLFQFGIHDKDSHESMPMNTIVEALDVLTGKPLDDKALHSPDANNYPVLIHSKYGKHRTGVLVGCYRKWQGWSLESAIDEYKKFAGDEVRDSDLLFIQDFNIRTYKKTVKEVIPGLSNDIALMCLARISHGYHGILESVSKTWMERVRSHEYAKVKMDNGWSGHWFLVMTEEARAKEWIAFDPEADRWHPAPRTADLEAVGLNYYHQGFKCATVKKQFLVIVGCYVTRKHFFKGACFKTIRVCTTNKTVAFDPFSKEWKTLASMQIERVDFACAVIEDKVYVVGGQNGGSTAGPMGEVYDPDTDRWEELPLPFMPYGGACSGVAFEDRLYVVGISAGVPGFTTQSFNPMHRTWEVLANDFLLPLDPFHTRFTQQQHFVDRTVVVGDSNMYTFRYTTQHHIIHAKEFLGGQWVAIGNVPPHLVESYSPPPWDQVEIPPFGCGVVAYRRKYIYLLGGYLESGLGRSEVHLRDVKWFDPSEEMLIWRDARPMPHPGGKVTGCGVIE